MMNFNQVGMKTSTNKKAIDVFKQVQNEPKIFPDGTTHEFWRQKAKAAFPSDELKDRINQDAFFVGVCNVYRHTEKEKTFTLQEISDKFVGELNGYFDDYLTFRLDQPETEKRLPFKEWFEQYVINKSK